MRLALAALGLAACEAGTPAPTAICEAHSTVPTQCGPTLDLTPINQYDGALATAQAREDAVVLIDGSCTGTLIAARLGAVVLTAGHCVGLGDRTLIAFNVEAQPDGDPLVTNGTVFEQATEPDYALIRLDQLPAVAATALTTRPTELLAVIQHPRGAPKVIAEGRYLDSCGTLVVYGDLDTLVGSSGAGVLNDGGYIVGIHTDGDCAPDGSGTNRGASAAGIVEASAYLEPGDLADR